MNVNQFLGWALLFLIGILACVGGALMAVHEHKTYHKFGWRSLPFFIVSATCCALAAFF